MKKKVTIERKYYEELLAMGVILESITRVVESNSGNMETIKAIISGNKKGE